MVTTVIPTQEEVTALREGILHVLEIYPGISPTMLQMGLGPSTQSRKWKPILEELINQGLVERSTMPALSPNGRHHSYVKLNLKNAATSDSTAEDELTG